ncbi:hypothetical protein D3C81_1745790 [compost metagenome]
MALLLKLLQLAEQLLRFLRGQHSCRLIKDEDLGSAHQCLQNLHLLLHADGQVLYLGFGIDR